MLTEMETEPFFKPPYAPYKVYPSNSIKEAKSDIFIIDYKQFLLKNFLYFGDCGVALRAFLLCKLKDYHTKNRKPIL